MHAYQWTNQTRLPIRLQSPEGRPGQEPAEGSVDASRSDTSHVGRVALYERQSCGHVTPTPAGQAKVDRNVALGIRLFLGQLH
jgi:hypothetical protein